GTFDIVTQSEAQTLSFLVSYVGYRSQTFSLNITEQTNWKDVSVRLAPDAFAGKEIIVKGINFYTASDTVLSGLIKVGAFSPLGESNAVRSLQMLPSVSMSTAVNDGIN